MNLFMTIVVHDAAKPFLVLELNVKSKLIPANDKAKLTYFSSLAVKLYLFLPVTWIMKTCILDVKDDLIDLYNSFH